LFWSGRDSGLPRLDSISSSRVQALHSIRSLNDLQAAASFLAAHAPLSNILTMHAVYSV
jgi:hypothetical protein